MKTIPKKLRIFGQDITVQMSKDLISKEDACGMADYAKKIIRLDKSLQGEDRTQTLLHEVFHIVLARVGLNQTSLPHDLEELIVENLATAVVELFDIQLRTPRKAKPKSKKPTVTKKKN